MSQREKSVRRINWNRYADFRSRNTRDDLLRLCSKYSDSHLKNAFKTPDKTGLYPIHWASIHNRSDLIDVMLDKGSPLKDRCRNKLFSDANSLQLAAMNGSIEAMSVLLNRCNSAGDWIRERDADGQTALMRCAAPRSKRMDTVRDLLRKNLWSLSGRPAEAALYLISRGANWRDVDSVEGMNLMHLAIVNDYDDIVCMLLVIDREMASIAVQLMKHPKKHSPEAFKAKTKNGELESINLDSSGRSSASYSPSSEDALGSQESLIDKRTRTNQLIGKNMLPLQLAIIHSRIGMINLLWSAQETERNHDQDDDETIYGGPNQRLQSIINRVYWANKHQLVRFVRSGVLKFALAVDLTLITLVWMPVYLDNDDDRLSITIRNGLFVLSYFTTMALAFRVMLMKPGYLKRDESRYFSEIQSLTKTSSKQQIGHQGAETKDDQAKASTSKSEKTRSEPAPKVRDIAERVRLLCHKCRCIRRPRSRHCNYCSHCVRDFDHHCIYLSCCIGRKNRLDFLLMILSLTLMAIYGSFIQANSIEHGRWHHGWHLIGFVWIFKYVLIGGLTSFFILKRASHGVTMYEEIRSNRIRKIFGNKGPPESISKSHRHYATTLKGSFWRYSPNRFLTGDLSRRTIMNNLREYANYSSVWNHLLSATGAAGTQLARAVTTIGERNKASNIS